MSSRRHGSRRCGCGEHVERGAQRTDARVGEQRVAAVFDHGNRAAPKFVREQRTERARRAQEHCDLTGRRAGVERGFDAVGHEMHFVRGRAQRDTSTGAPSVRADDRRGRADERRGRGELAHRRRTAPADGEFESTHVRPLLGELDDAVLRAAKAIDRLRFVADREDDGAERLEQANCTTVGVLEFVDQRCA